MKDYCHTHGVHNLAAECPACVAGKFPGFPPGAVGYCAMGHSEIWSKEIACPLCAVIKQRDKLVAQCAAAGYLDKEISE